MSTTGRHVDPAVGARIFRCSTDYLKTTDRAHDVYGGSEGEPRNPRRPIRVPSLLSPDSKDHRLKQVGDMLFRRLSRRARPRYNLEDQMLTERRGHEQPDCINCHVRLRRVQATSAVGAISKARALKRRPIRRSEMSPTLSVLTATIRRRCNCE